MTAGVIAVALALGAVYLWYGQRARRLAAERLAALVERPDPREADEALLRTIRTFPARYPLLAPATGVLTALLFWLAFGLPLEVSVAAGVLIGVLVYLAEGFVAERRIATIEIQLAEAIDLLVGSLRAGASLLSAFESSLEETAPPLRPYFKELAGRIRLGEDPQLAVSELPHHVPLETFRLFATSLAVHWEVGGSLATTLSTVGRTIRDRIELSRRVRTQSVEVHASVGIVMVIAYVLGFLMWSANPERLLAFVTTDVGTELVAGVIGLQAFGLLWMSRISRADF